MSDIKSIRELFTVITYNDYKALNIFAKYRLIEKYKSNVNYYTEYIISQGDSWDNLSHKFFSTPKLWWVLAIFNEIKDPFQEFVVGTKIKIIKAHHIDDVLITIRKVKTGTV